MQLNNILTKLSRCMLNQSLTLTNVKNIDFMNYYLVTMKQNNRHLIIVYILKYNINICLQTWVGPIRQSEDCSIA